MTNCFAALPKTLRKLNWLIIVQQEAFAWEKEKGRRTDRKIKIGLAFFKQFHKEMFESCSTHYFIRNRISNEVKSKFPQGILLNFAISVVIALQHLVERNSFFFSLCIFSCFLFSFFFFSNTANRWCFWWIVEILQNHLACANPMHEHQENHHHQRIFTQTTEFLPFFPQSVI